MLKANNSLGLVFFPAFDWEISPSHPERKERLLYTMDQLKEEGIFDIDGIKLFNPTLAKEKDIERVHFCYPNVKARVPKSHLISAGGAIKAGEIVLNKRVDKSFAIVRPPGHHAHRVVFGDRGFCIINIEAVMIENLRKRFGDLKVAIIDTDCHHGDGSQDIFWNDRDTLFISLHQDGRTLYPGSGFLDEMGGPGGFGYNINIPLPPSTGDEGFLYLLDNLILPILDDYKPDLIINSAGQDNHYTDPLTSMNFTAQGYAKLNQRLNPDIAILEGGYSIEGALPYINLGIILAMAGIDYGKVMEPDYDPERLKQSKDVTEYIKSLCQRSYSNWKNKNEIAKDLFKNKEYITRHKNIYYDTDGITENQTERIDICDSCSGLIVIESNSDRNSNLLGITIPRDGCSKCIDKGYNLFQNSTNYSRIFIQDKPNDTFLSK